MYQHGNLHLCTITFTLNGNSTALRMTACYQTDRLHVYLCHGGTYTHRIAFAAFSTSSCSCYIRNYTRHFGEISWSQRNVRWDLAEDFWGKRDLKDNVWLCWIYVLICDFYMWKLIFLWRPVSYWWPPFSVRTFSVLRKDLQRELQI